MVCLGIKQAMELLVHCQLVVGKSTNLARFLFQIDKSSFVCFLFLLSGFCKRKGLSGPLSDRLVQFC
jgi:hypothetical protein